MSNAYFSYDIGTAMLSMFVVLAWIIVVYAVASMLGRVLTTLIAISLLLYLTGQVNVLLWLELFIYQTWNGIQSLWHAIF